MRHPPSRGARMTVHVSYTSFPRTQGEAPSQYYVPLAGFSVNKYLPSLQLQKRWICVFIFEINMCDPHTVQLANFYAYTIPKLEILFLYQYIWSSYDIIISEFLRAYDPQTGNIAYCPVKNGSKFIIWPVYCIKSSKHFEEFCTKITNWKYSILAGQKWFKIHHSTRILHQIFKTFWRILY